MTIQQIELKELELTPVAEDALTQLIFDMLEDNYVVGAPNPDVEELDTKIISMLPCRRCTNSRIYQGFHRNNLYRAFSICSHCGEIKEL